MRIVHTALMSLLLSSASPSISVAQVLFPFEGKPWPRYDERLDRPVPVATVSRVGDFFALADARIVEDGHGEPFVLGAATLDLRDPAHAKVVFTMTNTTGTPVLFKDVMIHEVALCAVPRRDGLYTFPQVGARPADGVHDPREFQPGEKVTVQIPIPPSCGKAAEPLGIVVSVGRPGPGQWSSSPALRANTRFVVNKELIFRVLERLRAEASTDEPRSREMNMR
jgi:hypothetical protein